MGNKTVLQKQDKPLNLTETEFSAPQEETGNFEISEEAEKANEQPTIKIRYRHKDIELSAEEAAKYAQLGKHFEDNLKDVFDILQYLAAGENKSVREFVSQLKQTAEEKYRNELIQEFGEDSPRVEELLELKRRRNDEALLTSLEAQKAEEEKGEKDLDRKIAEDFYALRSEFPQIGEFKDLPKSVKEAAFDGKDLVTEYLLYRHRENAKIKEEKEKQEKNKNESTGSFSTTNAYPQYEDAFIKGLWNRN